jgi:glycosyltransferase involved in cell wall biosynthesis
MSPEKGAILILSHFFEPFMLVSAKRSSYLASYLTDRGYPVMVLKAGNRHYNENHLGQLKRSQPFTVREITLPLTDSARQTDRLWYHAYQKEIRFLMQRRNIRCLYISGHPFFYFPLGQFFRKKYGVPYILDFRDTWYQDRRIHYAQRGLLTRVRFYRSSFLDRSRERQAVKNASYVINVTQKRTSIYRQYYRRLNPDKFITIPNGYDETSVPRKRAASDYADGCLKFGIFGKFGYYNRSHVDMLMEACRKSQKRLNFVFHHWGAARFENYLIDQVKGYHLTDYFRFHGQTDYETGMRDLEQMDCLIINIRYKADFPTKIYDYIWLNKPVIAILSPGSELGHLLKRFEHAYEVHSATELSVKMHAMAHLAPKQLDPNIDTHHYSRRHAADQLLPYLEQVMAT